MKKLTGLYLIVLFLFAACSMEEGSNLDTLSVLGEGSEQEVKLKESLEGIPPGTQVGCSWRCDVNERDRQ